jgi:hypothetical protein
MDSAQRPSAEPERIAAFRCRHAVCGDPTAAGRASLPFAALALVTAAAPVNGLAGEDAAAGLAVAP